MRFKSVKSAKDVALAGIAIAIEQVDSSIQSVTFTDVDGRLVRLSLRSYSLQVEIPEPPKMVKRWHVSGTVLGLPLSLYFKDERGANSAIAKYQIATADPHATVALSAEQVEVPEESAEELPAEELDLPF